MTRAQIVAFTKETVRRVLANEIGVLPLQRRHRKRFAELQKEKEKETQRQKERARISA